MRDSKSTRKPPISNFTITISSRSNYRVHALLSFHSIVKFSQFLESSFSPIRDIKVQVHYIKVHCSIRSPDLPSIQILYKYAFDSFHAVVPHLVKFLGNFLGSHI